MAFPVLASTQRSAQGSNQFDVGTSMSASPARLQPVDGASPVSVEKPSSTPSFVVQIVKTPVVLFWNRGSALPKPSKSPVATNLSPTGGGPGLKRFVVATLPFLRIQSE